MGNCLGIDVESKYLVGNVKAAPSEAQASDAQDAAALLGGSLAHCTWIELNIQCTKLRHADALSKSDPMAILYEYRNGAMCEHSRTEMIANNYDPCFVKRFKLMYNFELVQRYRVVVVDLDKGQDPDTVLPDRCNFLGACDFELGEVVAAKSSKLVRSLNDREGKATQSTVTVMAEELSNCKDHYRFQLQAHNLRNVDFLSKSDPFLQISRLQEDGVTWLPVYKTETLTNNIRPTWKELHVCAAQLNNGDIHRPLRLQVYDYEANGAHRMLGWHEMSTQEMRELASKHGAVVSLRPPPGKRPGDYGTLQVLSFATETRRSFLDYIAGGVEIGFVVAVDFTKSNGDPREPTSKHYISGGPTQYEQAIMGIGSVIMHYDQDKAFPMYGFGGLQQGERTANHCFKLGSSPDGMCVGVEGLLAAYRRALSEWRLFGPTNFSPVIRKATSMAAESVRAVGPPKYTCLLILTDGEVTDLQATIDSIIDASPLPMSVLIVGIGHAAFEKMKALDSDKTRLCSGNRYAERDIVQFVEFHKLAFDGARLAQELLAELPGQLVDYCTRNKVMPAPALPAHALSTPTMKSPAAIAPP